MKKLLVLPLLGLAIAGCDNDHLPMECQTTMDKFNRLIKETEKHKLPSYIATKLKQERDNFKKEIKKLDQEQAIQVCKQANQSL